MQKRKSTIKAPETPHNVTGKPIWIYYSDSLSYDKEEFKNLVDAVVFAKKNGRRCAFHRGSTLMGIWNKERGFVAE